MRCNELLFSSDFVEHLLDRIRQNALLREVLADCRTARVDDLDCLLLRVFQLPLLLTLRLLASKPLDLVLSLISWLQ